MDYPITNSFFQEEARDEEEAKRNLVIASRILANEGVFDAFGHISVRNPKNKNHYFISRALAPDEVTLDDLIEMDIDNNIVDAKEGYRPFSESAIHSAIYAARPDINCVCHAHPLEITPFTASDIPLGIVTHLSVVFYEGIPVYEDIDPKCGLLINNMDEGKKLADCLGEKRGALIRNHGMVAVGETISRAVYSTIIMRDNAKVLQQTFSMGAEPKIISTEEAEYGTYVEFCGQGLQRSWNYWTKRAKKAFPEIIDY